MPLTVSQGLRSSPATVVQHNYLAVRCVCRESRQCRPLQDLGDKDRRDPTPSYPPAEVRSAAPSGQHRQQGLGDLGRSLFVDE